MDAHYQIVKARAEGMWLVFHLHPARCPCSCHDDNLKLMSSFISSLWTVTAQGSDIKISCLHSEILFCLHFLQRLLTCTSWTAVLRRRDLWWSSTSFLLFIALSQAEERTPNITIISVLWSFMLSLTKPFFTPQRMKTRRACPMELVYTASSGNMVWTSFQLVHHAPPYSLPSVRPDNYHSSVDWHTGHIPLPPNI